ncbi:hypothetical protein AB0F46_04100 [Streptomyces sp. NPDC026665]|uniref:hypothetical protein n=1 Tax=Streptomyces sp. NPDC026665 TaxID=3154798 RepID=UPI003402FF82
MTPDPTPAEPAPSDPTPAEPAPPPGEQARLALEKKRERYVWYYLAYFLFGIHIVAFVMIYAVLSTK